MVKVFGTIRDAVDMQHKRVFRFKMNEVLADLNITIYDIANISVPYDDDLQTQSYADILKEILESGEFRRVFYNPEKEIIVFGLHKDDAPNVKDYYVICDKRKKVKTAVQVVTQLMLLENEC